MFLNAAGLPHRHANNLQDADLYKHAHSAHINLVICMVLMAAFHYVWNILPMLSLASPPLSWQCFSSVLTLGAVSFNEIRLH